MPDVMQSMAGMGNMTEQVIATMMNKGHYHWYNPKDETRVEMKTDNSVSNLQTKDEFKSPV